MKHIVALLLAIVPWGQKSAAMSLPTDPVSGAIKAGAALVGPAECGYEARAACPTLPAALLAQLLTMPTDGASNLPHVIHLQNVVISGELDLGWSQLQRGLWLSGPQCVLQGIDLHGARSDWPVTISCPIAGGVNLEEAQLQGGFSLRGATPIKGGIKGQGAKLNGNLDLSHTSVSDEVILSHARIGGSLFLGNTVSKSLNLQGISVGEDVWLDHARAGDVHAEDSRIAGQMRIGSDAIGALHLNGAEIGQMRRVPNDKDAPDAPFALEAPDMIVRRGVQLKDSMIVDLSIRGARIGGDLDLEGSTIASMEGENAVIGGAVRMNGAAVSGDVHLGGINVIGDFDLRPRPGAGSVAKSRSVISHFGGGFNADNLQDKGNVYLDGAVFKSDLHAVFAHVSGNIDLRDTRAASIILNGSVIGSELQLWPTTKGLLSLRGVHVATITDGGRRRGCTRDQLPLLDLDGLTYQSLQGFDSTRGDLMQRKHQWLACMLARERLFSFQPYVQLASVLRAGGLSAGADSVLWAANRRDLANSWHKNDCFGFVRSLILGVLIGWGIGAGYLMAFLWTGIVVMLGATLLHGSARDHSGAYQPFSWCVAASLAKLSPINLGEDFSEWFKNSAGRELSKRRQNYFVLHSLVGAFLSACIAAAVTGLTQSRW